MGILRGARVVALTMAYGVMVVIAAYVVLIAINWRDEPPSADALALQRISDERSPVADEDNAFVLMLGLAVPRTQDPMAVGKVRRAFLEAFDASSYAPDAPIDFPTADFDYKLARSQATAAISEACAKGDTACAYLLQQDPAEVARWIASEAWLLERYRSLLARPQWREAPCKDASAPLPKYQHAMEAQKLLLMQAWLHARAGQGDAARDLMRQDLAYWRMVLRSSDILITKMIANTAVERHFALGNLVLRELKDTGQPAAPPAGWDVPISREERSMWRTLAGESAFARAMLAHGLDHRAGASRMLLDPLYQRQATHNRYAARMVRLAKAMDVDVRGTPTSLASTRAAVTEDMFRAYNPVGHILDQLNASADYTGYATRLNDLEGARRAALLAVELRRDPSDDATAEARIQAAALKDPYTDRAFEWDATTGSIVFNGLATGERARHAYLL